MKPWKKNEEAIPPVKKETEKIIKICGKGSIIAHLVKYVGDKVFEQPTSNVFDSEKSSN